MIKNQFIRLRDGDGFWSQNHLFSDEQLDDIGNTTLADIIVRNTKIKRNEIDGSAFYVN
ncbi:MAG: hypothetical protein HRU34_17850 [Richelia sp.]|nr:hypothetical protein [Richelia sp.]